MAVVEFYKSFSDSKETHLLSCGKTIAENFPDIEDWKDYVIIVNKCWNEPSHVVCQSDSVIIRKIPKGLDPLSWVLIGISIVSLGAGIWGGVEAYKSKKESEKALKELEKLKNSSKDSVTNIPYLKGASNSVATGKTQPYMIGKNLFTPYILNAGKNYKGYSTISGTNGKDQFYNVVLECGFKKQNFKKVYCEDITLKTFNNDECQEGIFNLNSDSVFSSSDSFLEIAQDGNPFQTEGFNQKIIEKQMNDILNQHDSENPTDYKDLFYTLENNSMGVDVCILFNGMRKTLEDGVSGAKTRNIIPSYSVDYAHLVAIGDSDPVNHATWHTFIFDQNGTSSNTFTYNSLTQLRFNAHKNFSFSELFSNGERRYEEPVTIKISTPDVKPTEGSEFSDCYVQWIHSYCYDIKKSTSSFVKERIIGEKESALSTLMGIRIKSTTANEDKLNSIQIISSGVAKTWNGSAWSNTRTPTSNPASWLLEVLTSDCHAPSKISENMIDLESFGDWYEFCEDKDLTVNYVITSGMTKSALFDLICDCGRGYMYQNIYGKIAIAIDGEKENAIAVLNEQNMVSFSYTKDMKRKPDGLKLTYIDEGMDYQQNTITIMYDESNPDERSADTVLSSVNVQGKTNHDEVCRHGYYLMKKEKLRPKVAKASIGNEGLFFTPLSKVLVQHPSLKLGKGSGEIKSIITNENEDIIGLELYDTVNLETLNNYKMIVQSVSGDFCTPLEITIRGGSGITDTVELVTAISSSASVVPHPLDTFSYGLNVETITEEMIITAIETEENGYSLTLANYDERIIDDSEELPDYIPSFSLPSKPNGVIPSSIPSNQVQEFLESTSAVLSAQIEEIEEKGVTTATFEMELSNSVVVKNGSILNPSTITAEAVEKQGTATRRSFTGIFKIFINNNQVAYYTSSSPESSVTLNVPQTAETVRFELWNSTNTNRIDRETVPIIAEGGEGYLVLLDNTFISLKGSASGVLESSETYSTVKGYRGSDSMQCVIDEAKMKELNGTIAGLEYDTVGLDMLKVKFLEGSNLQESGRILVPVLIDSEVEVYSYGYADEDDNEYVSYSKPEGSKYIILYFDYQKIKVKDVNRETVIENEPKYLGKYESFEDVPSCGLGDWFLYSGTTDSALGLFKGHFYMWDSSNAWIDKSETQTKEMDDVFNDMLSIVDSSSSDAPIVSIVNRLVTSEAFIDKLATRMISLQNGGEIKSANYVEGSSGFKIDYNGNCEFSKGRFRASLGNKLTSTNADSPYTPKVLNELVIIDMEITTRNYTMPDNPVTIKNYKVMGCFIVNKGEYAEMGEIREPLDIIALYKDSDFSFSKDLIYEPLPSGMIHAYQVMKYNYTLSDGSQISKETTKTIFDGLVLIEEITYRFNISVLNIT